MITTVSTERFTIIHKTDTESIVSTQDGCTGWLEWDTMQDNGGLERLVVHLQHDGDTCPIHEQHDDYSNDPREAIMNAWDGERDQPRF